MKYIISILLLAIGLNAFSQTYQANIKDSTIFRPSTYEGAINYTRGIQWADTLRILPQAPIWSPLRAGTVTLNTAVTELYGWDGVQWNLLSGGGGSLIPGGAFTTSNVQVGFNPGVSITADSLLKAVFYGIQPPTADLDGGTTIELTALTTVDATLNWEAGRQSNTPILTSIVVAGVTQSFSQPAQNSTVSGTQDVEVPANVTTVYSNVVTAADAQTATANTTFNFLGRKYYGMLDDTTGITAGSLNADIIALTSVFATTKSISTSTGSITGTQFWCYAYPATLGDLTALAFNSIPALEAMNKITLSITNASGYTQNYTVYYNKQGQTVESDITAQ